MDYNPSQLERRMYRVWAERVHYAGVVSLDEISVPAFSAEEAKQIVEAIVLAPPQNYRPYYRVTEVVKIVNFML